MNYQSKIIKIDSNNATKYENEYKTSFFYQFDEINTYQHQSIIYSVLNCSIPYSFYAVNKNNQYLDVEEKINDETNQRTVVIPAGNYSAIDFARTLKELLNENSNVIYEITYNKVNNRYFISITTPDTSAIFKFETGENNNESCYRFLGMLKADIIINHVPLLSFNSIIMNDISYLQIRSDLGTNILSSTNEDNIMEIIPINAAPYGYISYAPYQPNKYLLQSKSLNSISISLLDNKNNPVNLNGLGFLITIKIDFLDNKENNIPFAEGRKTQQQQQLLMNHEDKTNLQIISENPSSINIATPQDPISVSDWIDYQNIKKMIKQLNKKK
jgi:hypothetical protein